MDLEEDEAPHPQPGDKKCSIKTSLKSVLKNPEDQRKILEITHSTHFIRVHVLQFLKLYMLWCFETQGIMPFPKVTEDLVQAIIFVLCEDEEGGKRTRPPNPETIELRDHLHHFHLTHYKPTMADPEERLGFNNMTQLMQYFAAEVVKDYENNIKLHFVQHLNLFLDVLYDKKEVRATKDKDACTQLNADINAAREFLLFQPGAQREAQPGARPRKKPRVEETSQQVPPKLVEHLNHIIPQRAFEKCSVHYDIQCSPQDYLLCLLHMMKFVEDRGGKIPNLFPMCTSMIPRYVRLDTTLIVKLLLPKDSALGGSKKLLKDVIGNQDAVWREVFHLEKHCFAPNERNKFEFGYTIQTDGVACSIFLVERGTQGLKKIKLAEKRVQRALPKDHPLKRNKAEEEPTKKEKKKNKAKAYVQPTADRRKKIVGVDPGKSDIIYCSSGEGKDEWFRYTQNQKRYETGEKKHRRARSKMATSVVDGKTVTEWETELSEFSRKALTVAASKAYFTKKNEINARLFPHYQQQAYRVLKFRAFVNRRRSEDRMVNRFREKFGSKDEVVLGWGDWSEGSSMKFLEPTKGIGMQRLFKRAGYEVLMVDEFRTSCRCYGCKGGECEKFREVENPRPWMREERPMVLRHGLLSCTSCKRLWNRDRNGSLNIMRCAEAARRGEERPVYLRRNSVGG